MFIVPGIVLICFLLLIVFFVVALPEDKWENREVFETLRSGEDCLKTTKESKIKYTWISFW